MAAKMGRFDHGGDVYAHPLAIDFSANINPLGMPDAVKSALKDNIDSFDVYPDSQCRALRKAIAREMSVNFDEVLCTSGASDLIQRVCRASRLQTGIVTAPCFSGYEQALEQADIRIVRHRLHAEQDFGLTDGVVDVIAAHPGSLVFLCNPNNPTGAVIERGLIERAVEVAGAVGSIVVLDECFLDFTDEPSAALLVRSYPNLVVMRAFTKLYAMAGLRLGYGICSDANFVAAAHAAGQPWAVSTPAQVAGVAALSQKDWPARSRAYVKAARQELVESLVRLGLRVVESQANYVLFQYRAGLYESLLECGFVIRRCENYEGLDESWFRIAVRTREENAALIAAMKEVCA